MIYLVFWSHVKKVCIIKTNQFHLRSVANVGLLTLANIVTAISSIVSYYIILYYRAVVLDIIIAG